MSSARPPTIDPVAAARWLRLPRPAAAWLHEEVGRRMEERLDWLRARPASWLHWEPALGGGSADAALRRRYPEARVFVAGQDAPRRAAAPARPWWHPVRLLGRGRATEASAPAGVELLWANMGLHMAGDPQAWIARWQQELAVDGVLMFSCLGPDTLRELRALYAALGWPPPTHEFTDMHDWGDMLVAAGFADPVLDTERIVLTFADPARLLQELRGLGRNLHPARFGALRGRAWQAQMHAALARELRAEAAPGQLALTFEVIYGHAVKAPPRLPLASETAVPLEVLRASLHRPRRTGGA